MELLLAHYRPQTIEIAERFKFFKRMQKPSEMVVEFMSELRALAKSCNFGEYLRTVLRDRFVCGLKDSKCQQELLSIADLTVELAQRKTQAAEVVAIETKSIKESGKEDAIQQDEDVNALRVTCYRCGKEGHKAADCRHKNAKCHACHKTGYLANVCRLNSRKATVKKVVMANFMVKVAVNGVPIDMEIDTGAECSTIPAALFEEQLATICKAQPSQVTLRQYDQTPLKVVGQCSVKLRVGARHLTGVFIIVDIPSKHPLLGRQRWGHAAKTRFRENKCSAADLCGRGDSDRVQ